MRLILNGVFRAADTNDATAVAMEARGNASLGAMPEGLRALPRIDVPLLPYGLVGIEALRTIGAGPSGPAQAGPAPAEPAAASVLGDGTLEALVEEIAARGKGVVMTMGKGGVGKTTVAARIATQLARQGHTVTLTTTDPAALVEAAARERLSDLTVTRIDPDLETRRYTEDVLATEGAGLDAQGRALLEEDLRSPCTEEIAVFRAFAATVAEGEGQFVVIDTAPTGHTLLLLDAAEAYHREVLRKADGSPEAVQRLLPRLRDPAYTQVLLVTLPEATPSHEAMQLERDLARADITPFAWVVNQSLTPLDVTDPVLRSRRAHEQRHLREIADHAARTVLEPWMDEQDAIESPTSRERDLSAVSWDIRQGESMPIYIYESIPQTPGEEPCYFEFEQHMTDEPLTTHPETGVPLRRVFRGGFSVGTGGQPSGGSGGCCGSSSGCCGLAHPPVPTLR